MASRSIDERSHRRPRSKKGPQGVAGYVIALIRWDWFRTAVLTALLVFWAVFPNFHGEMPTKVFVGVLILGAVLQIGVGLAQYFREGEIRQVKRDAERLNRYNRILWALMSRQARRAAAQIGLPEKSERLLAGAKRDHRISYYAFDPAGDELILVGRHGTRESLNRWGTRRIPCSGLAREALDSLNVECYSVDATTEARRLRQKTDAKELGMPSILAHGASMDSKFFVFVPVANSIGDAVGLCILESTASAGIFDADGKEIPEDRIAKFFAAERLWIPDLSESVAAADLIENLKPRS